MFDREAFFYPASSRFILDNPSNGGQPVALARFSEQLDGASKDNHLADCSFEGFEIRGERVKLKQYNPHAKGLDLQYMLRATFRDLHIYDTAATGLG